MYELTVGYDNGSYRSVGTFNTINDALVKRREVLGDWYQITTHRDGKCVLVAEGPLGE
jgi:hypothetical protein